MNSAQPSLLSAAWRYRGWVIVVTSFALAVAAVYLIMQPEQVSYRAMASVVLQEPVSTDGVVSTEVASGRFVASQVEIMDSPVVAAEAAEMLQDSGLDIDTEGVSEAIAITSSEESPVVSIAATHPSPEWAMAISNAVADGYRQVSGRQSTASAESELTQINAQLEGVEDRLGEISRELASILAADESLARIETEARNAMTVIPDLQAQLAEAEDEEADEIRQQIQDLRDRIDLYEQVSQAFSEGPEQTALIEEQTALITHRAELMSLRDQVAVDANLVPDAVALVQYGQSASPMGTAAAPRTLGIAGMVGLAVGFALAYFLAMTRRSFAARTEPEEVLRAPLLADIPDFAEEGLESSLPVRDYPRSVAAEAFRFAASSLAVSARSRGIRSLAVLTATQGQGKTTVLLNTAVSAALDGASVLVVDSDFGSQQATRLLLDRGQRGLGITDVLEGSATLVSAISRIDLGDRAGLSFLGRGQHPSMAASSLGTDSAVGLFKTLADEFDLVFVDAPPLLQVAYASRIAELVEGIVVVIGHESTYREAEDLVGRLSLIGTPIVGYIYNRSPVRREMTRSEGSTVDILGLGDFDEPVASAGWWRRIRRSRPQAS